MFSKKIFFILAGMVLSLLLLLRTSSAIRIEARTLVPMSVILLLSIIFTYVIKNWSTIGFQSKIKNKEFSAEELLYELKFDSIIPRDDYIAVKRKDGSLKLFRFIRVVEIPYSIEDMEKDRKLWMMENVARLLSAINFECKLIHSIKPYDRDVYLKELKRKREELQVKIDVLGKRADLETKLRLFDRIIERLVIGEQAFDDDIVLQVSVTGKSEQSLVSELAKNTKMLQAMLESSLNLRTKILKGNEAWFCFHELIGAN